MVFKIWAFEFDRRTLKHCAKMAWAWRSLDRDYARKFVTWARAAQARAWEFILLG